MNFQIGNFIKQLTLNEICHDEKRKFILIFVHSKQNLTPLVLINSNVTCFL